MPKLNLDRLVYPIEYDATHVFIRGRREPIVRRQERKTVPIVRYSHDDMGNPIREEIGKQTVNGYIYFRHTGHFLRGYFKKSCGRFSIVSLMFMKDRGEEPVETVVFPRPTKAKSTKKIKLAPSARVRVHGDYKEEKYVDGEKLAKIEKIEQDNPKHAQQIIAKRKGLAEYASDLEKEKKLREKVEKRKKNLQVDDGVDTSLPREELEKITNMKKGFKHGGQYREYQ